MEEKRLKPDKSHDYYTHTIVYFFKLQIKMFLDIISLNKNKVSNFGRKPPILRQGVSGLQQTTTATMMIGGTEGRQTATACLTLTREGVLHTGCEKFKRPIRHSLV